jgi:LacI family transcriptional regulator
MARKKKVRLQDIADKTGYSISTVSHVINKTRTVDPNTKEIVLEAIVELGYQLPSKRTQVTRSQTIGVIIADIRVDFFNELIKELEELTYEEGYHIVVMDSEENPEKEIQCLKKLIKDEVAGIILAPCDTKADLSFCKHFPIVQVDRMLDGDLFDFVGIDNMMVTYYLTKKLANSTTGKIGFISHSDENYCSRERRKGYNLAMIESGLYDSDHTLVISYDADTNNHNISKFITNNPDIETIICASANICYEVLGEVKRLGKNNSIKNLCTYANNKWFDHVVFPVDAIAQPVTDIAVIAVDLLKEKIANPIPTGNSKRILLNSTVEGRSDLFINGSSSSSQLVE